MEFSREPEPCPRPRASGTMQIAIGLFTSLAVSARSDLLEIVIGSNDLSQLVFQSTIPAIGIGMVAFHQFLETRLNLGAGRAFLKPTLATVISPTAADAAGPALASMLIYLLMAAVLALRPQGFFPARL